MTNKLKKKKNKQINKLKKKKHVNIILIQPKSPSIILIIDLNVEDSSKRSSTLESYKFPSDIKIMILLLLCHCNM